MVQKVYLTFYDKISEPCPENNYFRGLSNGNISCIPCDKGTFLDRFKNTCVPKDDFEKITNPYDYAIAYCKTKNSVLGYIERGIFMEVVNSGSNSYNPNIFHCNIHCANGDTYYSKNCPSPVYLENNKFTPECLSGNCGDFSSSIYDDKTSIKNDYMPPSSSDTSNKVEANENDKGQICINGECSSINNGNSGNNNGSGSGETKPNPDEKPINPDNNGNNSSSGGGNSNNDNKDDICLNGSCGSYDGSNLKDYASKVDSLINSFSNFKDSLLNQYDNFKSSVDNFKNIVENGFKPFNFNTADTCVLNYELEFIEKKIKIELDFCKSLALVNPVFYVIFLCFFLCFVFKNYMEIYFTFFS